MPVIQASPKREARAFLFSGLWGVLIYVVSFQSGKVTLTPSPVACLGNSFVNTAVKNSAKYGNTLVSSALSSWIYKSESAAIRNQFSSLQELNPIRVFPHYWHKKEESFALALAKKAAAIISSISRSSYLDLSITIILLEG